ncbi:PadR family transcriptional regulator [Spirillospora sp. NPDC029432]|uniref:PadR family transcriptional regulator n=1 Tax=Spirillospora sp. NPDC029432 TaxID=3154599 RepID=UPI0034559F43
MSLRHAVLGLIAEVPGCSGYDLLKTFEVSLGHVWSATQSQLYGELGKLTADGLIEVTAEGPRGRKEYRATEAGRGELRRWLTETSPRTARRDESILRVFFLGSLEPAQARDYLRGLAAGAGGEHETLTELERTLDAQGGDPSDFGRIALEYGKRYMAMRRDWAEWAAGQIGP